MTWAAGGACASEAAGLVDFRVTYRLLTSILTNLWALFPPGSLLRARHHRVMLRTKTFVKSTGQDVKETVGNCEVGSHRSLRNQSRDSSLPLGQPDLVAQVALKFTSILVDRPNTANTSLHVECA